MEAFTPDTTFNCIVLRYCIGYLDDEAAVEFLQKMGQALETEHRMRARASSSKSFILLQDQTQGEGSNEGKVEGQKTRRRTSLENII